MLNFKIYGYFRIKSCFLYSLWLDSFQSNIDLNGVTELFFCTQHKRKGEFNKTIANIFSYIKNRHYKHERIKKKKNRMKK